MKQFATLFTLGLIAAFLSTPLLAQGSSSTTKAIKVYCQKIRKISPTDAEAYFKLGNWCSSQELADQAARSYKQAIAIDSDHAGARNALGYVRYGLDWKRLSELGKKSPGPVEVTKEAVPESGEDVEVPDDLTEPAAEATAVEGNIFSRALEAKKQWADNAAEAFQTKFQTIESDDFLIHTTHSSTRNAKVQALIRYLKSGKKILSFFLGVKSRDKLWPAKLQFVLLRSPEEYERFADIVDSVPDAVNPDGAYVAEQGHTVLYKPGSPAIAEEMGEQAFEYLYGSDRYVSWWIKEGVSELLVVQLSNSNDNKNKQKQKDVYKENYVLAGDMLERQEDLTIYSLLETSEYRRREREGKRALAMTLVDFLVKKKKKGFQELIRRLKSDEAPPIPASDNEDGLKDFNLKYISFQSEVLRETLRTDIEKIEIAWKKEVLRNAAVYRNQITSEKKDRRRR